MLNELPEHIKIPNAESGLLLSPYKGLWSLIVPEFSRNYIVNPSFEGPYDVDNFTKTNCTVSQDFTDSAHGISCVKVTPTLAALSKISMAVNYDEVGEPTTCSFELKGAKGESFVLTMTGDGLSDQLSVKGTGSWERYELSIGPRSVFGSFNTIEITKTTLTTTTYYTDAWQFEYLPYATTYFDGNSPGCFWSDVENFSSYSERPASLPVGAINGRIYDLEELGFSVTAYNGADMVEVNNIATPLALAGGSQYQRTTVPPRTFTLSAIVEGLNLYEVQRKLAALSSLVSPDTSRQKAKALALQFQLYDYAGKVPQGKPVRVPVVYAGGLGGPIDNLNQARRGVQFVEYRPASLEEVEQGRATLNFRNTLVASATAVGQSYAYNVNKNNSWARLLAAGAPISIATSLRTKLQSIGVAETVLVGGGNIVGQLSGADVIALTGSTPNNSVLALAQDMGRSLYVGGAFTTPQQYIMRYTSGFTYVALGTGVNNVVRAMLQTIHPTTGEERIYVGGDLTTAGGTAVLKLAYWSPGSSSWGTMAGASTGISGGSAVVNALAVGQDGTLYIGGGFTTATGGVSCNNIVGYNPTTATFFALGAGVNGTVRSLAVHPLTGELYVAGDFTTAGGITVNYVARWNGTNWQALGFGLNNTVNSIDFAEDGTLYLGGTFTKSGAAGAAAYTFPNKLCKWDGTNFLPIDLNVGWLPPPNVNHIAAYDQFNTFIVGTAAAGGAAAVYTGANTTVTYNGTAPGSKTTLHFVGPGLLYEVTNLTTGQSLYFKDCYIATGEVAVLDLETGQFYSNFRPNLSNKLMPGPVASWALMPGDNTIKVYFENSTSGTSRAIATWRTLHFGVNAVAGQV